MIENISKIQYVLVANKIYKVTHIDFGNLTIEASKTDLSKTDLSIADVPEDEIFPVEEFEEFRIKLTNRSRMGEVIDFAEWVKNRKEGK